MIGIVLVSDSVCHTHYMHNSHQRSTVLFAALLWSEWSLYSLLPNWRCYGDVHLEIITSSSTFYTYMCVPRNIFKLNANLLLAELKFGLMPPSDWHDYGLLSSWQVEHFMGHRAKQYSFTRCLMLVHMHVTCFFNTNTNSL